MGSKEEKYIPINWQRRRELGGHKRSRHLETHSLRKHLYSSLGAVHKWDPKKTVDSTHHRGIFNFDFSPDGSLLAAACEGKSILLFDPFNGKLTGEKNKAHSDCVNCVRFLDSRLFATCSDDTTVALWDVRFLKNKLRNLQGHHNWVKNIEYDRQNGLLVTSGFDGNIFTWDINSYSETETKGKKVFSHKFLMRSKMSPDSSKLVISTQNGYIIVIHDLDLLTLNDDLKDFPFHGDPSQVLQKGNDRKRNRVEVIREWPIGDMAGDIASLQIHPQGWCMVSRNVSRNKRSEWTCIHDLQEGSKSSEGLTSDFSVMPHTSCCQSASTYTPASSSIAPTLVTTTPQTSTMGTPIARPRLAPSIIINPVTTDLCKAGEIAILQTNSSEETSTDPQVIIRSDPSESEETGRRYSSSLTIHITDRGEVAANSSGSAGRVRVLDFHPPSTSASAASQEPPGHSDSGVLNAVSSSNRFESRLSIPLSYTPRDDLESLLHDDLSSDSTDDDSDDLLSETDLDDVMVTAERRTQQSHSQDLVDLFVRYDARHGIIDVNHRYRLRPSHDNSFNKSNGRLLYYTEEPNVVRGFIKELCFSADGRLICSPFAYGVRLLSFDPQCNELCDVVPTAPMRLYELGTCVSHSNAVVTCKFSPQYCMFVSGCLSGKVIFHQPIL
ncbi:hypothetical protein FSP39_025441 [Pinctada imbricata]|uniref:DDB1- and CUL4-associated factor 10 homolog n=1 Tax=Pinctada imbricata TaxID=66713 RepID=A0AA88YC13_PINIB|nr:hypothetical protein FSP39_025441 [Pinctada imbricata]